MYKKILVCCLSLFVFVSFAQSVQAITPSLSLVANGNDSVTVTVTGDVNSNVILYYNSINSNMQSRSLGTTNYSGYLTTTVSTSNYGAVAGSQAYVLVNGQQSASFVWPNTVNGNNSSLSLSSTNITVGTGQSQTINIYNSNYSYNSYYISNNVNQNIASANVNGNTITIYGNNIGSTSFSVCSNSNLNYSGNSCSTVYVNVTSVIGNPNTGPLSFTQQNVTTVFVPINNSVYLSSNTTNGLYISRNSNSKVAQVFQSSNTYNNLSNSSITISGRKTGNTKLTICSNNTNSCSDIRVTVFDPYVTYVKKK